MQLTCTHLPSIYIIDVHTLQHDAWTICGPNGSSLRSVLEGRQYSKVVSDVRNDSDVLFNIYGIRFDGIFNLQLMEYFSRSSDHSHLNGRKKCIEYDSGLSDRVLKTWTTIKEHIQALMGVTNRQSQTVLHDRPISHTTFEYCAGNVEFMPVFLSF